MFQRQDKPTAPHNKQLDVVGIKEFLEVNSPLGEKYTNIRLSSVTHAGIETLVLTAECSMAYPEDGELIVTELHSLTSHVNSVPAIADSAYHLVLLDGGTWLFDPLDGVYAVKKVFRVGCDN